MAKLKSPLFSLTAEGHLSKALTFLRRRLSNIVVKPSTHKDRKSFAQLEWRHMYQKAVALWEALDAIEKLSWESLARPFHMTGFAYFISLALKPNPGLYLPLQGGKMAGEIDMDGYRIEDLPDPAANQDAATKAYVDLAVASAMWAEYLNDTPSGIDSYYEMSPEPTGEAKSTFTSGVLGTGDDQALFQWISDAVVTFGIIWAGTLNVHVHAERTAGNKSIKIYAEIYEYTNAAAEIFIATTELSAFITDAEAALSIHAALANDYEIALTSKLLIKFFANVGAAGANVTMALYAEGDTTSSISSPVPTSPIFEALIADHAAIAAAHHAKYTNAAAVAAAKTVKLDDFATPDDNTDLNSSTTKHGLLKKLNNNPATFLDGQGNWGPAGGGVAFTELVGGEDHQNAAGGTWQDWDLSGIVPAGTKSVIVAIAYIGANFGVCGARKNGSALNRYDNLDKIFETDSRWVFSVLTECDSSRIIETYAGAETQTYFQILGYWS